MPPKPQGPNKKTVEKKKEKIIEDKTFGLKNKKGAKTQKFVQQVQAQVKFGGASAAQLEAKKIEDKKKKEKEKAELDELNKIFKPVAEAQKVSKDVDPKTVLCAFFKQGNCGKGAKCKFSHDLAMERKTEKRNIYHDNREADTMDKWDDAKLSEVVQSKHGEKELLKPKTDIICKYFLDALENSKYGWFWECPNGDSCIYRHALPPGYVLKRDKKKLDELSKEDQITLEELIEKERTALGGNLTKVTLDSFLMWKKRKLREKRDKIKADEAKKMKEFKSGHQSGLSGRDLFTFNPDLILQDDEEADDTRYVAEKDENETEDETHDIDASLFMTVDIDGEITEFPENDAAGPSRLEINEDLFDPDDIPDSDEEETEDEESGDDGEAQVNGDVNGIEILRPEMEDLQLKES